MRCVTHNDNTGATTNTNIWALMSPTDMAELKQQCPAGHFTPTFFDPRIRGWKHHTPEYAAEIFKELPPTHEHGWYFEFPLDDAGQALLVKLRLLYYMEKVVCDDKYDPHKT